MIKKNEKVRGDIEKTMTRMRREFGITKRDEAGSKRREREIETVSDRLEMQYIDMGCSTTYPK